MSFWKIITIACTTSMLVDAKWIEHQKLDIPANICDSTYNNTNAVQCYCLTDNKHPYAIRSADCYLTSPKIAIDDAAWKAFKSLQEVHTIILTNTKGVPLTYVPTEALIETSDLVKLDIKYATLNVIGSFAFANLSSVQEITLSGDQIVVLEPYAFIHHKNLKMINLDSNNIVEINRDIFVDLPALEKLYLTNNQISTIHDKAFVHLINLREMEIDTNKVFSLNYATFEGLKKLEKLDLSRNSLEVIGDNTFQALENLEILNLEENKIQMLDDKAFNGLNNLQSLSLARNKLIDLNNAKVFEGLNSLMSLSLKGNQMKELSSSVMAPILNNFYGDGSNLDVEDNNFPCSCRLDWFMILLNNTQNKHLKTIIENLKCLPDSSLREAWTNLEDTEKNTPQEFAEVESQVQGTDYEYYDDTQLNGKLFYVDIRDLLNCSKITNADTLTKDTHSPTTTVKSITVDTDVDPSLTDFLLESSTSKQGVNKRENNMMGKNDVDKEEAFTTTRLVTVSAKPIENKIYENMASDEAKPDKVKAHRSIHETNDLKRIEENSKTNNANINLGCVLMLTIMLLCSRLNF